MANGMTRPGLLAFMPPQRAARMFTQMAQPPQAQVSPGRVSPLPYPVYESGPMRGKAMPPYMDLQQRAAAQAQAMPPRPMPLEQAAMRAAQIRGAFGGQRAPQAPAAGGMGRIADAFRQPLTSPTGQGIAAAALTGLEYGGPSMTPTSLGQGLARMGAAGLQAYSQAEKARQAREAAEAKARQDEEYRQQMLQLKKEEISATTEAARIKASGDASTKQVEREMTRAKDFRAASKDFDAANLNYGRIVANATAPNPTGATDIAMIFNFMKMLDPTSVVRGSEYEAAAGAGSLLRSLGVQYNRLFNNEDEKLAPEVRRAFLQTAAETFEPYIDAQELVEDDFRTEAKSQGLRSDRVISRSRIPQRGTKDFPYIAYSQQEADNYPKGSFVMMSGVIGQVK